MTVSEKLNTMTDTFSADREFCDELFSSENAEQAAELLVAHLWANNAFTYCQKSICHEQSLARFGASHKDKAGIWTFALSEHLFKDLSLVVYLVIRGLPSEAGTALRRAFEHFGVLAHIWHDPTKLDAFDNPESPSYSEAFKYESDPNARKLLKAKGIAKRFEAMSAANVATTIYGLLSGFSVHGGTKERISEIGIDATTLSCRFYTRPEVNSEKLGHQLWIFAQGHLLLCSEFIGLCARYGTKNDKLVEAFECLRPLLPIEDKRSKMMQEQVRCFLEKLRTV